MVREINQDEILSKVTDLEIVVFVEVAPTKAEFDHLHISGAIYLPTEGLLRFAESYLPDKGMEIVVYSSRSYVNEAEQAARALAALGYGNVYLFRGQRLPDGSYRGGKEEWVEESLPIEGLRIPPKPPADPEYTGSHQRDAREFKVGRSAA